MSDDDTDYSAQLGGSARSKKKKGKEKCRGRVIRRGHHREKFLPDRIRDGGFTVKLSSTAREMIQRGNGLQHEDHERPERHDSRKGSDSQEQTTRSIEKLDNDDSRGSESGTEYVEKNSGYQPSDFEEDDNNE